MQRIEKDIEVQAPLMTVYDQWTQFESFPEFMEGVKSVRQLDDRHIFWQAEILGREVEWTAEIIEQVPDECIAWRCTSGHPNMGAVYFEPLALDRTKVTLVLEYEPQGATEKIADALGALAMRVEGDLRRFRKFIEKRGTATGAWRGEIHRGSVN
jgi:uncharacterized membrane protein